MNKYSSLMRESEGDAELLTFIFERFGHFRRFFDETKRKKVVGYFDANFPLFLVLGLVLGFKRTWFLSIDLFLPIQLQLNLGCDKPTTKNQEQEPIPRTFRRTQNVKFPMSRINKSYENTALVIVVNIFSRSEDLFKLQAKSSMMKMHILFFSIFSTFSRTFSSKVSKY